MLTDFSSGQTTTLTTALCLTLALASCGGSSSSSSSPGSGGNPPPVSTGPDSDNDGVADAADQCADTPASAEVDTEGCPPADTADGRSYDSILSSDVDGEAIAFTVHEPTVIHPDKTYPMILHSHGYGGSRQSARPTSGLLKQFIDNGYYVLSLDERGHGDSGGQIRILDPALEGQDWLQVLDWAEENLDQLRYLDNGPTAATASTNPVMGAVGGSYGGGFQHLIYAIDEKHRLDAIAPDITWHDLRYSLYSGNVFKTQWATVLSAGGRGRQHQEVNEGLASGLTLNTLDQDKLDLLYRHSLISHCENNNALTTTGGLRPIDAFLTQSHLDTLFNFNDASMNYDCLKALGGDVRLFTKSAGHGLDNGDGGQNCGSLERDDATFQWFEEKLKFKTGAAASIPTICLNIGKEGSDGVVVDAITKGGTPITIEPLTMILSEANPQTEVIPLYTATKDNELLAGLPSITATLTDPTASGTPGADPILFVGLGVQAAGSSETPTPLMNQMAPLRGYGTFNQELIGVMTRLQEGDQVVLLLSSAFSPQYTSSGSTTPSPTDISAIVSLPLLDEDEYSTAP